MDFATKELLKGYKDQNREIIKRNSKLNERISVLEGVIQGLRQDIVHFRIKTAMAKKTTTQKDNPVISKKKKGVLRSKDNETQADSLQKLLSSTRRKTKPISYVLPSTKSKLRKGDPFTFGNE